MSESCTDRIAMLEKALEDCRANLALVSTNTLDDNVLLNDGNMFMADKGTQRKVNNNDQHDEDDVIQYLENQLRLDSKSPSHMCQSRPRSGTITHFRPSTPNVNALNASFFHTVERMSPMIRNEKSSAYLLSPSRRAERRFSRQASAAQQTEKLLKELQTFRQENEKKLRRSKAFCESEYSRFISRHDRMNGLHKILRRNLNLVSLELKEREKCDGDGENEDDTNLIQNFHKNNRLIPHFSHSHSYSSNVPSSSISSSSSSLSLVLSENNNDDDDYIDFDENSNNNNNNNINNDDDDDDDDDDGRPFNNLQDEIELIFTKLEQVKKEKMTTEKILDHIFSEINELKLKKDEKIDFLEKEKNIMMKIKKINKDLDTEKAKLKTFSKNISDNFLSLKSKEVECETVHKLIDDRKKSTCRIEKYLQNLKKEYEICEDSKDKNKSERLYKLAEDISRYERLLEFQMQQGDKSKKELEDALETFTGLHVVHEEKKLNVARLKISIAQKETELSSLKKERNNNFILNNKNDEKICFNLNNSDDHNINNNNINKQIRKTSLLQFKSKSDQNNNTYNQNNKVNNEEKSINDDNSSGTHMSQRSLLDTSNKNKSNNNNNKRKLIFYDGTTFECQDFSERNMFKVALSHLENLTLSQEKHLKFLTPSFLMDLLKIIQNKIDNFEENKELNLKRLKISVEKANDFYSTLVKEIKENELILAQKLKSFLSLGRGNMTKNLSKPLSDLINPNNLFLFPFELVHLNIFEQNLINQKNIPISPQSFQLKKIEKSKKSDDEESNQNLNQNNNNNNIEDDDVIIETNGQKFTQTSNDYNYNNNNNYSGCVKSKNEVKLNETNENVKENLVTKTNNNHDDEEEEQNENESFMLSQHIIDFDEQSEALEFLKDPLGLPCFLMSPANALDILKVAQVRSESRAKNEKQNKAGVSNFDESVLSYKDAVSFNGGKCPQDWLWVRRRIRFTGQRHCMRIEVRRPAHHASVSHHQKTSRLFGSSNFVTESSCKFEDLIKMEIKLTGRGVDHHQSKIERIKSFNQNQNQSHVHANEMLCDEDLCLEQWLSLMPNMPSNIDNYDDDDETKQSHPNNNNYYVNRQKFTSSGVRDKILESADAQKIYFYLSLYFKNRVLRLGFFDYYLFLKLKATIEDLFKELYGRQNKKLTISYLPLATSKSLFVNQNLSMPAEFLQRQQKDFLSLHKQFLKHFSQSYKEHQILAKKTRKNHRK